MVTREMAIASLREKREAEKRKTEEFYEAGFKMLLGMAFAQGIVITIATYMGVM